MVEVNESQGDIETKELNLPTNNTSIQDYQITRDREIRERRPNPRYESQNLMILLCFLVKPLNILNLLLLKKLYGPKSENWKKAREEQMNP